MDLHRMSPARVALQSAIAGYANAERAAKDAVAAYDVQKAELANAEAALEKFSDLDSQSAKLTAARAKAKAKGNWRDGEPGEFDGSNMNWNKTERNLRAQRTAQRKAQMEVADDRAALTQLEQEREEADHEVIAAAVKRTNAIEAVLAEEGAALLARAQEAEAEAASLRARLMAIDGLHIAAAGVKPRLILANSAIAGNQEIVRFLRAPLPESAPSHEQRSLWRALVAALETDAEAVIDDEAVQAAAAAMPRPASFQPPQVRWEDSPAYRGEAAQAAQVTPLSPHPVSIAPSPPVNDPKAQLRWEDSPAKLAPWAKPQGEPMTQRYEDSPEYAAQRSAFGRA